jgi:tetratricopeptide (TPR) repeat protein
MKPFLSTLCVMTLAISAVAQKPLPRTLQHLKSVAQDEEALVKSARLYHRQQIELNDWDYNTASIYRDEDVAKVIGMYEGRIRTRTESVKTMWEYVLSIYPKNAMAMNYMGEYWYDMGNNKHAGVRFWKEALMINDELALAHNNIGLHYSHFGEPKRGYLSHKRALEIEPKKPDFLYNMAQFYMTQFHILEKETKKSSSELYKAAMEFSKDAAEADPEEYVYQMDYATNFYAAQNFGVSADWVKAALAWRKAHDIAPGKLESFFTRLNEGRCWIFAGRKTEAMTALAAARELNGNSKVIETLVERAQAIEGIDTSPKRVWVKTEITSPTTKQ